MRLLIALAIAGAMAAPAEAGFPWHMLPHIDLCQVLNPPPPECYPRPHCWDPIDPPIVWHDRVLPDVLRQDEQASLTLSPDPSELLGLIH